MTKRKKIMISSVVVVIIAVVVMLNMGQDEAVGTEVQTEKVSRGTLVKTVAASGKIQPATDVKISANISAKITKMGVEEGDKVSKGQFLVALDRTNYLASVNSAKAGLSAAEADVRRNLANLKKAQTEYNRTKELVDKKLASASELDVAEADLGVGKALLDAANDQVEQAKALLTRAEDDLSKTEIYSPMSGTISKLNKEIGEIALGSQFQEDVIMIVSDLSRMEALVDVDENDVVSVAIGDTARIEVDALPDRIIEGIVTEIASSAKITAEGSTDQKTEFEVKITIIEKVVELRPGMSTTTDIITDVKEDVLSVPIQSVTIRTPQTLKRKNNLEGSEGVAVADDSATQQYIPNKDGLVEVVFIVKDEIAEARQVKTGIQSESHIEILEGLDEGDLAVIGSYRAISKDLENGSPVSLKQEGDDEED